MDGIKIMNLEGSNILKNNLEELNINKEYNGVFADSLLLDKLKSLKLDVSKNNTTKDIVTVEFNFGYTPRLELNTKEIEELQKKNEELKDKIKQLEKEKKAISKRADKKLKINEIEEHKETIKNNKIKISQKKTEDEEKIELNSIDVDAIRDRLYKEGFKLDFYKKDKVTGKMKIDKTIHYKMWFRSPSKSRIGDITFINEKLYPIIKIWQRMGLQLPDSQAKIVEMAAYESLTSSHICGKIKLDPKHILVIDDIKSFFTTNCAIVRTNEKGECFVDHKLYKVSNTLFDGQCLLDDSLYSKSDNSVKLLRQHFFKSCAFRAYVTKFMKDWCKENGKDYNTYCVRDRYGNDIKVSDILMICTENSMKWEKFQDIGASYELWKQKVTEDGNLFGVAKEEHISKYNNIFDDGKCYQRMSYQHVNTLDLKDESEMEELVADTVRYVNNLKDDNKLYLEFLKRNASQVNGNEMIINLYNNIKDFDKSEFFRTYKTKDISNYVKTIRNGKILSEGDNLTIVGNPYTMLLHAVGQVPVKDGVLAESYIDVTLPIANEGEDQYISVYTKRFADQEYLASFRNPHNSPNNCGYNKCFRHPLMEEYFNFTENVMAVNLIQTEEQDLKNGLDMDSDFCYVTNSKIAVLSAKRVFRVFPCIVNKIPIEKDLKYDNTIENFSLVDRNLAKAKFDIGLSSNLAQLAMSWYYEDKSTELADIVCIMSVIAQVAIDNCKRAYRLSIRDELDRISNLPCMNKKVINSKGREIKAKPLFWDGVSKNVNEESLINCTCPMNYLQSVLDKKIKNGSKSKDTIDSVKFINVIVGKAESKQLDKIEAAVKKYDDEVKKHNDMVKKGIIKETKAVKEKWKTQQQIMQKDLVDNISNMTLSQKTVQILINKALSKNGMNRKYKNKLLNSLYQSEKHRKLFMNCFKSN